MPGSIMLRAGTSNVDSSATTQGFIKEPTKFIPGDDPDVARVRVTFPHCTVMPLSTLTFNETAMNNGDVMHFSASFLVR